jgi:hypothetical protein
MIRIRSHTQKTFRPIYERVQNGKAALWFYDGYFFKSVAKAQEYIEAKWLFTDPMSHDIVKMPRSIDRTVWYPISIPFLIQDEVCDVAGKPITSLTLDDINDFLNGREHHFDSNKTSSSYSKRSN